MKKILVTGASGFVGGLVYRHFASDSKNFETLALDRTLEPSARVPKGREIHFSPENFFCEDLATSHRLEEIFKGIDIIAHLAADPRIEAPSQDIERDNVTATRRLYEAAAQAGVKRIILASTSVVLAGYGFKRPFFSKRLTHESPVRPVGDYASSKVLCEEIARDHAKRAGLSSICIRIGAVTPNDLPSADPRWRPWWCSERDAAEIFEKAALCEGPLFDIFFAISKNRGRLVDLDHAKKVLGFVPKDGAS